MSLVCSTPTGPLKHSSDQKSVRTVASWILLTTISSSSRGVEDSARSQGSQGTSTSDCFVCCPLIGVACQVQTQLSRLLLRRCCRASYSRSLRMECERLGQKI